MLPLERELAALKFIDGLSGHLTDVREPHKALRHALRDTREFFQATHGCIATLRAGRPEADLLFTVPKHTGWDLGVNVTWSLWDGGRSRADRAAAIAQSAALRERSADFDALVGVEVKLRRTPRAGSATESVNRDRLGRMRATLALFAAEYDQAFVVELRLDLVTVTPADGGQWRLARHPRVDAW